MGKNGRERKKEGKGVKRKREEGSKENVFEGKRRHTFIASANSSSDRFGGLRSVVER
jgi:hypothetical protein